MQVLLAQLDVYNLIDRAAVDTLKSCIPFVPHLFDELLIDCLMEFSYLH